MTKGNGRKAAVAAAIYIRVSSERQAREDKVSLKDQRERCEAWCTAQGIPVEQIYEDAGLSGELDVDRRPGIKALVEGARAGRFDRVVFLKIDRVARNLRVFLNWHHDVQGLGVSIVSIIEGFDTSTSTGRFTMNVLGSVAEMERDEIARRTVGGRRAAIDAGRIAGGAVPFWLHYDKDTHVWSLNDEAARTVRDIAAWYVDGSSADAIALRLSKSHLIPSDTNSHWNGRKGKGWRASTVMSILRSPTIAGALYLVSPDVLSVLAREEDKRGRTEARRKVLWQVINEGETQEQADQIAQAADLVRVPVPPVIDWVMFRRIQ